MRKLLVMATAMVAVALTATSCLWTADESIQQHWRLISFIDGDATTGLYGIFDDDSKVCIENNEDIVVPKEYFHKGEARALVTYENVNVVTPGYSHTIEVKGLECIRTTDIYNGLEENVANEYNDGMSIYEMTYARNYINLNINFRTGGIGERISAHDFVLVYNKDINKAGPHQTAYQQDGFLYLELYHDAKNDTGSYNSLMKRCYLFDPTLLGLDMTNYRGIKIIFKSMADGTSKVVTLTEFK